VRGGRHSVGSFRKNKFKRIGNQYNIRMIFRTRHTRRSLLMGTRPEGDRPQAVQCMTVAEAMLVKQADL
jgi:hypothetical protein